MTDSSQVCYKISDQRFVLPDQCIFASSTPACWGACKIGLQWSINGVLIEPFPLVVGSRAEGGVASKLGDETQLMTMKGGTVLDSVKILACMLGGCNIGLQWSINGVLIETFPSCSGIESRRGCGFQTRG